MPSKGRTKDRPFSLLVKPASADCNLACDYCFYLPVAGLYPHTPVHRMEDDVLERLVRSYLATRQQVYSFIWQGGEPGLMGADFFRRVTGLQEKYGRPGARVFNAFQTNGTTITPELALHFSRYRFLTGVSIDGPREMHDMRRKGRDGAGSYGRTIRGLRMLQDEGAAVNGMVLVHADNVDFPEEIYRHLDGLGIRHHQYIPCLEFDEAGKPKPWTVTSEKWGEFLVRLFQIWYPGDTGRVSVRLFESVLRVLGGEEPAMCSMGRSCSGYLVAEYNGDVYPCDFYVDEKLRLGNIMEQSWEEVRRSKLYAEFAREKNRLSGACSSCTVLPFCSGGCPLHRRGGKDLLCAGWKLFFEETLPYFNKLSENIIRN